jgi:4,5-DOPA dioxygenase extradiol
MHRRKFIQLVSTVGAFSFTAMNSQSLAALGQRLEASPKMPVLFVGHGNPMNAIEDNVFSRTWRNVGRTLKPQMILCISAHWETRGSFVTAMEKPKTIHDFGGFPQALFDAQYPAPGSPETADLIAQTVQTPTIHTTEEWGLDHGTWSILMQMFPHADVPVMQLSIDRTLSAEGMYELGKQLAFLRTRGALIVGSGNVVHNLGMVRWGDDPKPYDWALEFDAKVKTLLEARDHRSLIDYRSLGEAARLSIPTPEHYLPMLYVLGLQEKQEEVHHFNEHMAFGSGSMRSFIIS